MLQHFPVDKIKLNPQQLEVIRNLMFNPKSRQIYEN